MRHLLVVVPLLVLGSATVISAQSNPEQDVLRVHKEYESGLAHRDASAFERLLADDYTYTPANGRVVDKASQIAFTRGNTLGDASLAFRSEDLRIRIYGDAAVVTGLWGMALTKGDQAVGGGQARYIVVYVKRNATWQIVAEQRTFVP